MNDYVLNIVDLAGDITMRLDTIEMLTDELIQARNDHHRMDMLMIAINDVLTGGRACIKNMLRASGKGVASHE